jgi:D-alanyl-lipoteichoic acid acyltransferase DltB (MBOAT superfamily)
LFKKFALADTLALIALNDQNATQINSPFWLWAVVYAYAWRLYFDFSGYTDMALGLARWLGVRLPENFERPYTKPNLTQFWNSWHITLAQWFRAYFFNPVTRALRSQPLAPAVIIFLGQAGTMMLIALWHGLTWNFAAWGAWHALGLFIHNRWADYAKGRYPKLLVSKVWSVAGTIFTFHFVALGWVWFALSDVGVATKVLQKLFGLNP